MLKILFFIVIFLQLVKTDYIFTKISGRLQLMQVEEDDKSEMSLKRVLSVRGFRHFFFYDFYFERVDENDDVWVFFWVDVGSGRIKRGEIKTKSLGAKTHHSQQQRLSNIRILHDTSLESTDQLLFDWVSRHLYWVDTKRGVVEVGAINRPLRRVLVWDVPNIKFLALDPIRGHIFWSETRHISKTGMDGQGRSVCVDDTHVSSMTLDHHTSHLVWFDHMAQSIFIIASDCTGHRRLLQKHTSSSSPFFMSITLAFSLRYVFFNDFSNEILKVVPKTRNNTHHNTSSLINGGYDNIQSVNYETRLSSRMASSFEESCKRKACSHFCLRRPSISLSSSYFSSPSYSSFLPSSSSSSSSSPIQIACSCDAGILLHEDNTTCKPGPTHFLLISRHKELLMISMDTPDHPIRSLRVKVPSYGDGVIYRQNNKNNNNNNQNNKIDLNSNYLSNKKSKNDKSKHNQSKHTSSHKAPKKSLKITALSYNDGYVYWSDVVTHTIIKSPLDSHDPGKVLFSRGIKCVEGLAIDHLSSKMYWVDSGLKRLYVGSLDGTQMGILVSSGLHNPRSIALDPFIGLVFWTDWREGRERIERIKMGGNNRTIIIQNTQGDTKQPLISWPNGLVVDTEDKRVYWGDGRLGAICSCSYHGDDVRVLLRQYHGHFVGLSFMDGMLYWIDWQSRSVERLSKLPGSEKKVVVEEVPDMLAITTVSTTYNKNNNKNINNINNNDNNNNTNFNNNNNNYIVTNIGFKSNIKHSHQSPSFMTFHEGGGCVYVVRDDDDSSHKNNNNNNNGIKNIEVNTIGNTIVNNNKKTKESKKYEMVMVDGLGGKVGGLVYDETRNVVVWVEEAKGVAHKGVLVWEDGEVVQQPLTTDFNVKLLKKNTKSTSNETKTSANKQPKLSITNITTTPAFNNTPPTSFNYDKSTGNLYVLHKDFIELNDWKGKVVLRWSGVVLVVVDHINRYLLAVTNHTETHSIYISLLNGRHRQRLVKDVGRVVDMCVGDLRVFWLDSHDLVQSVNYYGSDRKALNMRNALKIHVWMNSLIWYNGSHLLQTTVTNISTVVLALQHNPISFFNVIPPDSVAVDNFCEDVPSDVCDGVCVNLPRTLDNINNNKNEEQPAEINNNIRNTKALFPTSYHTTLYNVVCDNHHGMVFLISTDDNRLIQLSPQNAVLDVISPLTNDISSFNITSNNYLHYHNITWKNDLKYDGSVRFNDASRLYSSSQVHRPSTPPPITSPLYLLYTSHDGVSIILLHQRLLVLKHGAQTRKTWFLDKGKMQVTDPTTNEFTRDKPLYNNPANAPSNKATSCPTSAFYHLGWIYYNDPSNWRILRLSAHSSASDIVVSSPRIKPAVIAYSLHDGLLCWSDVFSTIECMQLKNKNIRNSKKNNQNKNNKNSNNKDTFTKLINITADKLYYDTYNKQLLWHNTLSKTIETQRRRVVVYDVGGVVGLSVVKGDLYWLTLDGRLEMMENYLKERKKRRIVLRSGILYAANNFGVVLKNESVTELREKVVGCDMSCSHGCVRGKCWCPKHMSLSADGMTCMMEEENCDENQFTCGENGGVENIDLIKFNTPRSSLRHGKHSRRNNTSLRRIGVVACIPEEWRCDGYVDCRNHSDEVGCVECGMGSVLCKQDQKCVREEGLCDGVDDCSDGSDEDGCVKCDAARSVCTSDGCYTPLQRCDGVIHCYNGADEEGCVRPDESHGSMLWIGLIFIFILVIVVVILLMRHCRLIPSKPTSMLTSSSEDNATNQTRTSSLPKYYSSPNQYFLPTHKHKCSTPKYISAISSYHDPSSSPYNSTVSSDVPLAPFPSPVATLLHTFKPSGRSDSCSCGSCSTILHPPPPPTVCSGRSLLRSHLTSPTFQSSFEPHSSLANQSERSTLINNTQSNTRDSFPLESGPLLPASGRSTFSKQPFTNHNKNVNDSDNNKNNIYNIIFARKNIGKDEKIYDDKKIDNNNNNIDNNTTSYPFLLANYVIPENKKTHSLASKNQLY